MHKSLRLKCAPQYECFYFCTYAMAPMAPMATVSPDIDPRHRLEGDDLLRTPESPYHCPLFVKESRLKLSWPREDDRRRAAVGGPSSRSTGNQDSPIENAPIVHVSQRDLEMHYHLTNPGARSVRPILDVPLAWNPGTSEEGHEVLLGYCGFIMPLNLRGVPH